MEQASWETAKTLNYGKLEMDTNSGLETFLCYNEKYLQKIQSFCFRKEKKFFNLKSAWPKVCLEKHFGKEKTKWGECLIETWQINKHLVKAMQLFVGWVVLNHLITATVVKSAGIRLLVFILKKNSTYAFWLKQAVTGD